MRANAGIICILLLLLLVGVAEAVGNPDIVTVTTDRPWEYQPWIIANNIDQSIITVTVMNTTPGADYGFVKGAIVNLAVDPIYGILNPTLLTTDASGKASSTFKVKTKSGAAQIFANITSSTVSGSAIQNIDHDSPYFVTFTHPLKGNVTEKVPFDLSMTDRHGNPVDNLNPHEIHTVSLHIHGPGPDDDCGFNTSSGLTHNYNATLDVIGKNASFVTLTSKIGNNYISMDPFGSISDKLESILAVTNGEPHFMNVSISNGGILPINNEIPANGVDKFTINYFLYDFYMNPLQNRSILINTNLTDELTPQPYRTNSLGQIQITYGPKVSVLTANITAVAEGYPNVTNSSIVKFVGSNVASNLYLVVSPQTMASRDCDPSTTREAKVVAILTDEWGNPVTTGEDVTFTISGISTAPNNALPGPSFESGVERLAKTIQTNSNGIANLTFYPGSFVTGESDFSTGHCTISANTSTYISNPVTVEWKNFAYLSVEVNATPRTVLVNETVDVTIRIKGDGYKMVSNPISVVLDLDTNNIMNAAEADAPSPPPPPPPRFNYAKDAAKYFVGTLNTSDQVGLVTWGEEDNMDYWLLVQNVSYNHALINSSIDSLFTKNNEVSVRQSIHEAVTNLITNPLRPANEVGAIITLGASSYGPGDRDLMVQETWINNGIRVYSISYVSTDCNLKSDGITYTNSKTEDMSLLARDAHGIHFCCTNSGQVIEALGIIRRNLSEIAGVNTSMNLDFAHPSVNNDTTTYSGSEVFDYVPIGPFVNHTKGNVDPFGRTSIIWTDGNQSVVDQSDNWTAANNYQLKFDIGTIRIKETWEATFRLRVLKEGVIDLFGSGSTISYNDFPGNLRLPTTLITSVNKSPPGFHGGNLDVLNLAVTKSGNFTDYVPMEWSLKYEGFNTATETLCYCVGDSCTEIEGCPNGPWVLFETRPDIEPGMYITRNSQLDVKNLPMGRYWVRVHAFAPPAPDDEETFGPINVGYTGVFIKLS